MLARRHPLTQEGDDIGRFDVMFSCADVADSYTVTYLERRRIRDPQRNRDALKDVTLWLGARSATLKVISSETGGKPAEIASLARGVVSSALVNDYAAMGARLLTVQTANERDAQTTIRIGNTGVAQNLPQLAASCGKKTAAAK
jgi:hypothetical protein